MSDSPLSDRLLDDEIRHHIEERVDRLVARGVEPDEARRRALVEFGDVERVRNELRRIDARWGGGSAGFGERFRQDLSFGVRQLRRRLGFSALAVLTLGLGIGAATAIFSVVKAVVLDPLPYPEPEELVAVQMVNPEGSDFSVSVPDFADLEAKVAAFQNLGASARADLALDAQGRPLSLVANQVTPGFFPVFGAAPIMGRVFGEDEAAPDPAPVAVLSHRAWQGVLGGDPDVVGRTLTLEGSAVTVIGVMPRGWEPLMETDLWTPLPVGPGEASRQDHFLEVAGRLADGVSIRAARAEARQAARALGQTYPDTNEGWSVRLTPLKEQLVGARRIQAGWVLLGAVGLLLLLACASVSNLLIASASARGREMGLRSALGAGRGRIVQQLLTESLVLAAAAAVVGVGLAYLAVPLLQAASPADTPRIGQAAVNLPVILVALGMALATGLVFGLTPVLHTVRRDPMDALGAGGRTTTGGSDRLRALLVAGQVAVTVTLLVGAALLATSFVRMRSADTGLPVESTWSVPLMMPGSSYDFESRRAAARQIGERLEAVPGVAAAGVTNVRPFAGWNTATDLNVEGRPSSPEDAPFVRWRIVDRSYFRAVEAEAIHGRLFEAADFSDEAEPVVVVTESLARRLFGDDLGAAPGRRVAMSWNGTNWRRIVGVVPDIEDVDVSTEAPRTMYLPAVGGWNWVVFMVRFEGEPVPRRRIQEAIWEVEPGLPVPVVEPLSRVLDEAVAAPRFNFLILSVFAGVALVLAVMGVYGVTLFAVRRRLREIGVRIAMGARESDVVKLMLGRGLGIAGLGTAAGVLMALGLGRFIDTLLFQTAPGNPGVMAGVAGVVLAAALLATWLPARRAGRVDPVEVLGAE